MSILVFIPARSGSKGIKNKNLIKIGKKKLIDYTLDTAKKLGKDTFYFVSTDSKKILKHCNLKGNMTSYIRPRYLATDKSSIIDSIFHAIRWLENVHKYKPESVLLLQPTSPFRNNKEIKKAINEFKKKNLKSLVGAVKMKQHPNECIELKNNKWNFITKFSEKISRRQDYNDNYYFIDGSFYLCKLSFLLKYKKFIHKNITKIKIFKNPLSIDIDELDDIKVAETYSHYYV